MALLASAADVIVEVGASAYGQLPADRTARVPSLLIKASHMFRQAAGRRQFTEATFTQRLQVVGGRVRLPEPPVTAVSSVLDDSGNAVQFVQDGVEWIKVGGHHNRDNSFGFGQAEDFSDSGFIVYTPADMADSGWFVTVTYDGGGVPDEVRITVAQMVARALQTDPNASTGVKYLDQTIGSINVRKQFSDWAAETVTMTDEERAIAESFIYPSTQPIVHRS